MLNKAILVVDDDPPMLQVLEKVLAGEGARVVCARHGRDALEILSKPLKNIDLLITDLRMPSASGLTLLSEARTLFPKLPVIVLTAFASPFVKNECFRQGAAAFLEKPFDSQMLLQAVSQIFLSGPTTSPNIS